MPSGLRVPGFLAAMIVSLPALAQMASPQAADGVSSGSTIDDAPYSSPYLYQNMGRGRGMSATIQYEAGYGSRESRNFAQEGVEQGLRLRFQPWQFLGVEAFGGVVLGTSKGDLKGQAASIEVIGRVLNQRKHFVNLDLGAGYIYDYRSDHVPRIRLTLGRSFGALDLSVSGLLEIPVGSAGRDEVDVMTSLAVSYGLLSWLRLGVEVAGEDLEGLGQSEAEGGAKILFGPTFCFTMPIRTMELILGMDPLSIHDANAAPMFDVFTMTADNTPYTAIKPTQDIKAMCPCGVSSASSALSAALPWDRTDAVPQQISDRLLWQRVFGANVPPPMPGPNASSAEHERAVRAMEIFHRYADRPAVARRELLAYLGGGDAD